MGKCVRCVMRHAAPRRQGRARAWRAPARAINIPRRHAEDTSTPCLDPVHISAPVSAAATPTTSLGGLRPWRRGWRSGVAPALAKTTGRPCRVIPFEVLLTKCSIHCRGAERIEVDQLRLAWLRRLLRRSICNVANALPPEARVAKIERRRLRWVWKTDPTLPGSTIALQPQDLARAESWLRDIAGIRTRLADGAGARSMPVGRRAMPQPPLRRGDGVPESEAGAAGRRAMAIEEPPGGVKPFARPFNLVRRRATGSSAPRSSRSNARSARPNDAWRPSPHDGDARAARRRPSRACSPVGFLRVSGTAA